MHVFSHAETPTAAVNVLSHATCKETWIGSLSVFRFGIHQKLVNTLRNEHTALVNIGGSVVPFQVGDTCLPPRLLWAKTDWVDF
jgi:uncharacterized membrane protein